KHHAERQISSEEEQRCKVERQGIAPRPGADNDADQRRDTDDRERETPAARPQVALRNGACVECDRNGERERQYHENCNDEPWNPRVSPIPKLSFALVYDPAGSQQRVAEHQADTREDRKRMHPIEGMAREMSVNDGNSPHHRADRRPLDECDDRGSDEQSPVPWPERVFRALAELEGDTPED